MKKIIEGIAQKASRTGVGLEVGAVNEVVVRNSLYALLHGRSPKYRLLTVDEENKRYKYDISIPGTALTVRGMQEGVARFALKDTATVAGRSTLARYIFSISAFMPEHLEWLFSKLETDDLKAALRDACAVLKQVVDTANKRHCSINWPKVYSVCSVKIMNALNTASKEEIIKMACAIYKGPACDEISNIRNDLRKRLQSGSSLEEHITDLIHELRLLSNFNPAIAGHYRFKKNVDLNKKSAGTLVIKPASVIRSLESENGEWEHEVDYKVSKYIRKHAYVNAEVIIAACLLLNVPVKITESNIEAILLSNGKVVYSFSRIFSFPKLSAPASFDGKLKGGITSTKEGMEVVDLIIQMHHTRDRERFSICYQRLAEEMGRIAKSIQENRKGLKNIKEEIASSVHDAFFSDNEQNNAVLDYGQQIADYFSKRAVFLQEFVSSRDYPILVEFVRQSNHLDKSNDFERYLENKRASDKAMENIAAKRASRRKALKLIRGIGESVGLISTVTGVITMSYVAYVRFYNERAKSFLSVISLGSSKLENVLILGIVLLTVGITLTVVSWISAKGAASAARSVRSAALGESTEGKFVLNCGDNAEYFLTVPQMPEGPELVGYIGSAETHRNIEAIQQRSGTTHSSISRDDPKKFLHGTKTEESMGCHSRFGIHN